MLLVYFSSKSGKPPKAAAKNGHTRPLMGKDSAHNPFVERAFEMLPCSNHERLTLDPPREALASHLMQLFTLCKQLLDTYIDCGHTKRRRRTNSSASCRDMCVMHLLVLDGILTMNDAPCLLTPRNQTFCHLPIYRKYP